MMRSFIDIIPEGYDKVMTGLWIKKEELSAKMRATELRIARTKPDLETIRILLAEREAMKKNLNNPFTPIVSIKEYYKILNDIKKIYKIFTDTAELIRAEEQALTVISKEIAEVERSMVEYQNPTNIISFRKRS